MVTEPEIVFTSGIFTSLLFCIFTLSERFLSDCDTGAYRCAQKGPGDYDMREMGIANDTLSTVKVPPGFKLTLYDGDKFRRINTDPLVLTEGEYDLPSRNFNDVTSSYKIERI